MAPLFMFVLILNLHMPILPHSKLRPPFLQFNGQLQTLLPGIFRKPNFPGYHRERLELKDGDFLDLDWIKKDSKKLIVLSHGLEGNSDRAYIKGMAGHFAANGWDVLAWNCRSCSEELNRLPKLYHHGEIIDIGHVIQHAQHDKAYDEIWLGGFSMGANISLNYLCKTGADIPSAVKGAVVCSAPVDLHDGVRQLHTKEGRFYRKRFFKMLSEKLKAKEQQFPGWVDVSKFDQVQDWQEFDRWFSAPINGFKDEIDFYTNASPIYYLDTLKHPILLVSALNDPLLGSKCYPSALAKEHPYFHYMEPKQGGHVGFAQRGADVSWFEAQALSFASSHN